ncbi:MAG: TRAP transporter substrate-binding protein [Peptococcaceae bacterium]|jgi:TRAP-type C4-dicarboxylate transport system substrate-binding protein|nr:TRAP transporter substrate-binding protein [Peptococcaceae bacterium]
MMKKKILLSLLALSVVLSMVLSGCGKQAAPQGSGDASAPEFKLKLVCDYPAQNDIRGEIIARFKTEVESNTNGKIVIEIYDNGTLFKGEQHAEAVPSGSAEMAFTQFGKGWPNSVPEFTLLGSSVFTDYQHALRCLYGDLGTLLEDQLDKKMNTKLLAWSGAGNVDALCTNKRLVKTPEDMKGLRMRVTTSGQVAFMEAYGASGVLMGAADMYMGLSRGTIDGVFSTAPGSAVSNKLYEVAKYWTRAAIVTSAMEHGFVMNKDVWNKLPEDYQKVIQAAAEKIAKALIEETMAANDMEWQNIAELPGVEVYTVPQDEIAHWEELLAPAKIKVLQEVMPQQKMDELMVIVEKYRQ